MRIDTIIFMTPVIGKMISKAILLERFGLFERVLRLSGLRPSENDADIALSQRKITSLRQVVALKNKFEVNAKKMSKAVDVINSPYPQHKAIRDEGYQAQFVLNDIANVVTNRIKFSDYQVQRLNRNVPSGSIEITPNGSYRYRRMPIGLAWW